MEDGGGGAGASEEVGAGTGVKVSGGVGASVEAGGGGGTGVSVDAGGAGGAGVSEEMGGASCLLGSLAPDTPLTSKAAVMSPITLVNLMMSPWMAQGWTIVQDSGRLAA